MRIVQLIVLCLAWSGLTTVSAEEPTAAAVEVADAAPARWGTSFGLGFDARWRREINPAFGEFTGGPQVFAAVRFERVTLQLELAQAATRRTRTGGLEIRNAANSAAAWGRYAVDRRGPWTSFVSLGGGARFERVRTTFDRAVDERRGTKRYLGLGLGSSYVCFSNLLLEAEARITSEEATKFPGLALVLRAGVTL